MMDDLSRIIHEEDECRYFKVCEEPEIQICKTTQHYLCSMYVHYSKLEELEELEGGEYGRN